MATIKLNSIPKELRAANQWLLWKLVLRGSEKTKVPFQTNGQCASSTNPATWASFDAIAPHVAEDLQPGFVFSVDDPFCGIDLDGCRNPETGECQEWARTIVQQLGSYAELSPSGTGLKVFVRATLPGDVGKKKELAEPMVSIKKPGIEVYDHGRYFAVTGWKLAGVPSTVNERQGQVDALMQRFWPPVVASVPTIRGESSNDVIDRARRYVARMPAAVSGSSGHNATFHAACVLVLGFGLSDGDAFALMQEFNSRCEPPWSDRELQHKVRQADKQPGERNYLRDAEQSEWRTLRLPVYAAQMPEPTARITTLESSVEAFADSVEQGQDALVTTGLHDLDFACGGGWAAGEMVIMAARPSHGKSAVALQCVHHWTSRGIPSLFVSEEMSSLSLGKRAVHSFSDLPESEWRGSIDRIRGEAKEHFRNRAPCYIVEGCRSVENVVEQVEKHVAENAVQCVVVDYAQLLKGKGASRYEQITNVSIALRQVTSKTQIVLLALCQLSRDIEGRDKFIPRMSDLKETGQLEQDADVILLNVWPYQADQSCEKSDYQFFIAKNRNRGIRQHAINCVFQPDRQRVLNAAPAHFDDPFPPIGTTTAHGFFSPSQYNFDA